MGLIGQIFLSNPVTSWNQTAVGGERTALCSQLLAFGVWNSPVQIATMAAEERHADEGLVLR
jgi:hypothetical protein